MITTIPVENFYEFYDKHEFHILKHTQDYLDLCGNTDEIEIDKDLFQKLIDLGYSNIFVINKDEEFVGYVSIAISSSVLFKGKLDIVIDHLYVVEAERGKGIFPEILKEVEATLKEQGITKYKIAFPCTNKHDCLAKKHSFNKTSSLYEKELGE